MTSTANPLGFKVGDRVKRSFSHCDYDQGVPEGRVGVITSIAHLGSTKQYCVLRWEHVLPGQEEFMSYYLDDNTLEFSAKESRKSGFGTFVKRMEVK